MKNAVQIANAIKDNKNLMNKVLKCDNSISIMIVLTDFIVDFDPYYIDNDKDLSPYLCESVFELLNK